MALKYIVSLLFVIIYVLFGNELGFSTSSPWWTHFTYPLQHTGLVHLVLNTLVFVTASRVMEKYVSWKILFPAIYSFAVIASFFAEQSLPTVGASGMVYAIFGMEAVIVLFNRSVWKQKAFFFSTILLMLLVSFLNAGSNFTVHSLSFLFGFAFYAIKRERHLLRHLSR